MNETTSDIGGLSDARKQEIIERLRERGVPKACPMCGHGQWALMDGYVKPLVQNQIENNQFKNVRGGDRFLPLVALICNKCGHVSQHAVGILGL
jgi:uncharacterized protein (DUF983 family)